MVHRTWFRSAFPVRKHAVRGASRASRQFDLEQLEQRTVMTASSVIFPTAYASQQTDLRPMDVIRSQNGVLEANVKMVTAGFDSNPILYGGQVELEAHGDDPSLAEIGPRMVSGASADYGSPFLQLFERAGRDFYALDPALFAPAAVEILNVDTGMRHRSGNLAPDVVTASFLPAAAPNAKTAG
jgi:hypothetical protein